MTPENKLLITMGGIMLTSFALLGFFAFPTGIPLCAAIGLAYGLKHKNKSFIRYSSIALGIGGMFVIYTLYLIYSM